MKKLYASLVAVAAATMVTASAAIPEIVRYEGRTQPVGMNPKITVPSQEALNRFASLASIENYNGPARAMQKVTADDLDGKSYVNLSTSLFNDNRESFESNNISFKKVGDELIVNMLLNFRSFTSSDGTVGSCPKGGPVATVEGNTLKIAYGQNIGTYTPAGGTAAGVFFVGYEFDYDADEFTSLVLDGEVTFTIDANGNMTADKNYAMYIDGLGWWTGVESSKFVIPNGTFAADYAEDGFVTTSDVYVEKQQVGSFERLFVSSVMEGDGYGVYFDLDDSDPSYAAAIEQIVLDAQADGFEPYYLCTAFWGNDEHTSVGSEKFVEATLSNNGQTLTFNDTWSYVSLAVGGGTLYWGGLNQPAVIDFTLAGAGVEDIIGDVDNSNAPVEYFNLQGIRVNEPAAGSLVIRRQGTEVSKILVK